MKIILCLLLSHGRAPLRQPMGLYLHILMSLFQHMAPMEVSALKLCLRMCQNTLEFWGIVTLSGHFRIFLS